MTISSIEHLADVKSHNVLMHTNLSFLTIQPEPITGSSRMKSGTATKILLEAILVKACNSIKHKDSQW